MHRLLERFGARRVLLGSLALAVLRWLLIGNLVDLVAVQVLAQALHAATFGAFHAASVAAVHRVFPEAAQARGQTLFSSLSYGAGGAAGALGAGWLWDAAGPGFAFSLSALAGLAGLLLAHGLKRQGL